MHDTGGAFTYYNNVWFVVGYLASLEVWQTTSGLLWELRQFHAVCGAGLPLHRVVRDLVALLVSTVVFQEVVGRVATTVPDGVVPSKGPEAAPGLAEVAPLHLA